MHTNTNTAIHINVNINASVQCHNVTELSINNNEQTCNFLQLQPDINCLLNSTQRNYFSILPKNHHSTIF